jgi:hypothetical protein
VDPPEMIEALAEDVEQLVAALEVATSSLVNIACGLRREAAHLRGEQ